MKWEHVLRQPLVPGLVTALLIWRLSSVGLSWPGVGALGGVVVWFGVSLIDWLYQIRRRRADLRSRMEDSLERALAPLSLVLLLDEPRQGDLAAVRRGVRDALALEDPDEDIVVEPAGHSPERPKTMRQFLVRHPAGVFGIFLSSRPYIADPVRFARETIRDKRLRKAVESHAAWLSVDLVSATPEESEGRHRAYALVGRLLAAFTGPDCLAIYAPGLSRCNEFDPALIERLRSGSPLSIFDEPTFEPVLEIEEDDPRMMAAVEEALRRWPEFVAAFRSRAEGKDDRYIVKAEFTEAGRSEFMWVSVGGVSEDGEIWGTLMNDPHELESLHRGMAVTVGMDRLNDWIYPGREGGLVGGFTLNVLTEDDET